MVGVGAVASSLLPEEVVANQKLMDAAGRWNDWLAGLPAKLTEPAGLGKDRLSFTGFYDALFGSASVSGAADGSNATPIGSGAGDGAGAGPTAAGSLAPEGGGGEDWLKRTQILIANWISGSPRGPDTLAESQKWIAGVLEGSPQDAALAANGKPPVKVGTRTPARLQTDRPAAPWSLKC